MTSSAWRPFWRASKSRWVLPYIDAAKVQRQHIIPPEVAPTKRHRKEAEQYAAAWVDRQRETGPVPAFRRPGDGPTARGLREKWVALRRETKVDGAPRYKPSTLADYEEHLVNRILKATAAEEKANLGAVGDVPLSSLDVQRARAWVRGLAAEVSPLRARNVFSTLRSLIDDAIVEQWVIMVENPLRSPAVTRELPEARRKTGKRPIVIEAEHMQRVIACDDVPEIRRVRYIVDACTGLSEGELAGRVWADIELEEHPTIDVTTSLATRGAEGWASIGTPKNEHRVRKLPLHSAAAEALRWWRAEGWADYVGRAPKTTDPVFPGPEGKFSRPASAAHLRRDLKAAGCPDTCAGHPVTAQALRRCFSTWLDEAGVSEEIRGRLMGHAAKTVTAKHYTAAALERDRGEVEKIPMRWVSPRGGSVPVPVPDPVPAAHEPARSSSHLRDLNSRPTVYEDYGRWCHQRNAATGGRQTPACFRFLQG